MNIEIANRLVNLRKENQLSQEALAEKLGISRQAVSKWERAEASPDTDNLILLARLYGVSLDELLQTEDEIPISEQEEERPETDNNKDSKWQWDDDKPDYVNIGLHGIHVKDGDDEVHIGWNGIHVKENSGKKYCGEDCYDGKEGNEVHIDKHGIFVDGKEYHAGDFKHYHMKPEFPMVAIIFIVYIVLGLMYSTWAIGLLLFLLIPICESLVSAIKHRNMNRFAYPVLVTGIYVLAGIYKDFWHPGWVLFLTIPVYYSLVNYIQWLFRNKKEDTETVE